MPHGGFCHVQLLSTDIEKTRSFYETIFGSTFEVVPGFETYALFNTPDGLGDGIDTGPDAEPPSPQGPIVRVETDNIEATLKQIGEPAAQSSSPRRRPPTRSTSTPSSATTSAIGSPSGVVTRRDAS